MKDRVISTNSLRKMALVVGKVKRALRRIGIGLLLLGLALGGVLIALSVWFQLGLPNPRELREEISYSPIGSPPGTKRTLTRSSSEYLTLPNLGKLLPGAVLISEDSAFFQHSGFDLEQIENAFRENWEKGKILRGGSTISQQLVKNIYLDRSRSFLRKLVEALITIKLEQQLTKKEILEIYLNVIEWGPGVYGAKAAARHYFKKSPRNLEPSEAAFLAAAIPRPLTASAQFRRGRISPSIAKRSQWVLTWMFRQRLVGELEYAFAKAELSRPEEFLNPNRPKPEIEAIPSTDELEALIQPITELPPESLDETSPTISEPTQQTD